jgi:hypothetical protein
MHRNVCDELYQFVTYRDSKEPDEIFLPRFARYIHGPRGVGKSYCLYEVVCKLRSDPQNRVIYIVDCGGWAGNRNTIAIEKLIKAICVAFSGDNEVIERCNSVAFDEYIINTMLLNYLPQYCILHKLKLYAVFDQHNGLTVLLYSSSLTISNDCCVF